MTLEELAAKLGAEFQGQADLKLTCSCGLDSLQKGGLAYVTGSGGIGNVPVPAELDRSLRKAPEENVGKETALIVPLNYEPRTGNLIFAEDPLDMHVKATRLLHPPLIPASGIHPSAIIADDAEMAFGVSVGPNVVIGNGVKIGERSRIHAGVVILDQASIGNDCEIFPNAVIQDRCLIGNRVIIQSNAVIGADGHGYYQREGINLKIPQIGIVVLEDDVEIGAGTTIDRARFTRTVIGQGSKIDNQVTAWASGGTASAAARSTGRASTDKPRWWTGYSVAAVIHFPRTTRDAHRQVLYLNEVIMCLLTH